MKICPNCQYENQETVKFCATCGLDLRTAQVAPDLSTTLTTRTETNTGGVAAGTNGVVVSGNVAGPVMINNYLVMGNTNQITLPTVSPQSELGRYLTQVISRLRYLPLLGISNSTSGGNLDLASAYVPLRLAVGLADKTELIPMAAALAPRQLVVLGGPGSGKTTLLRYLALLYARDALNGLTLLADQFGLAESGCLPLWVPLRDFGAFLQGQADVGYPLFWEFLKSYLPGASNPAVYEPLLQALETGRAVLLLDGLDEVGPQLMRMELARMIESFAARYYACRVIVTCRTTPYQQDPLHKPFRTVILQDLGPAEAEQFITAWHALAASNEMGPGDAAAAVAAQRTQELRAALQANAQLRALTSNPLLLTNMVLLQQSGVKLPERRVELYAALLELLLGQWDAGKEGEGWSTSAPFVEIAISPQQKQQVLQNLALFLRNAKRQAISENELFTLLNKEVQQLGLSSPLKTKQITEDFLRTLRTRAGLLVETAPSIYGFAHPALQEYLVARAVADRPDCIKYLLPHLPDPTWRETVLLVAGYFSTFSATQTTLLLKTIASQRPEPEPFHNLVLAMECLRDVGSTRVTENLLEEWRAQLRQSIETPLPENETLPWLRTLDKRGEQQRKEAILRRLNAIRTLRHLPEVASSLTQPMWVSPYGEPEWVTIPAGEFWLGGAGDRPAAEKPAHQLYLGEYHIARTPITNAQYHLFVAANNLRPPPHWPTGEPLPEQNTLPVVNISWKDALAYCAWLSKVTNKNILLPSEAQWEKAARGAVDQRLYPWGDTFDPVRCNTKELGENQLTPAGAFAEGASPYGCLDMVGNVWEWTTSLWGSTAEQPDFGYPYQPNDGREDLEASLELRRVLRGGGLQSTATEATCTTRGWELPNYGGPFAGFRVVWLAVDYPARLAALAQVTQFFDNAKFKVESNNLALVVTTTHWAKHRAYRRILLRFFAGDVHGAEIRDVAAQTQQPLMGLPVSTELAYVVYGGDLTDDAYWQMGACQIEHNLTIIPLQLSAIATILASTPPDRCHQMLGELEGPHQRGANLYASANAIRDPFLFFGRQPNIATVLARLECRQHAGIFGMRKVGKTSVLLHLAQKLSQQKVPHVFLDLQGTSLEAGETLTQAIAPMFTAILKNLWASAQSLWPKQTLPLLELPPEATLITSALFLEKVRTLWSARPADLAHPLVVIVDEVERLVPHASAPPMEYKRFDLFFSALRSLAQYDQCLVTVVAGDHPDIRAEFDFDLSQGVRNTMLELYDEHYLGFFSTAECEEMVLKIGNRMGLKYDPASLAQIYAASGGHPYIARTLCERIARAKPNWAGLTIEVADVTAAAAETIAQLTIYFDSWFKNLRSAEKAIVKAIVTTGLLPPHSDTSHRRHLEHQGVIRALPNGQWAIAADLLATWLKDKGL